MRRTLNKWGDQVDVVIKDSFDKKTRSSNNDSQVTVASFRIWRGWPADALPLLA